MAQYYVSKAGDDTNGGTSWSDAKLTIAGAYDVATTDDTINIAQGEYTEIIPKYKTVTYQGSGMDETVILGDIQTGRSTTATLTIKDLTIEVQESKSSYLYCGLIMERVRYNGNNKGTSSLFTYNTTMKADYCIFHNIGFNAYHCFGIRGLMQFNHCTIYSDAYYGNATNIHFYEVTAGSYVKNCIFVRVEFGSYSSAGGDAVEHKNNCIYNINYDDWWELDETEFIADPKFRAQESGDFSLLEGSPCINLGVAT